MSLELCNEFQFDKRREYGEGLYAKCASYTVVRHLAPLASIH